MLDSGANYNSGSTFIHALNGLPLRSDAKYANTANPASESKQLGSEASPAQPKRYPIRLTFEFIAPKRPIKLSTTEPLRVIVEEYKSDEGKEFIAFWILDKTFIGHGNTRDDAIRELAESLVHDYLFYSSKRARELTADAQAVKKLLKLYLAIQK